MLRQITVGLLVATLLVTLPAPSQAGKVFNPNRHALRVKVDDFITDAFPVIEAVVTVEAPRKLDFRYLNRDHVGVVEEEVPVRDLKVVPFVPPLSIALVLDDSGSMERDLKRMKESVDHFITELAERDEACLIGFHRGVQVHQTMTYSKPALRRALGTLRAYGATALYDGLLAGLQQLHRADSKRTLIVVSDGNDQVYPGGRPLSRLNVDNIVELARRAGVEIYSIGIGRRVDLDVMKTLAEKTGGFFWHAPNPRYLKPIFDTIARSFHSRVKIFYESPNANFDRRDRTVMVDFSMGEYNGRGIATYWLDRQAPARTLTVKRTTVKGPGLSRLRVFTWGVHRKNLEMEFFLYDNRGNLVRHGFTTQDGFGKLERSNSPQLTDIKPGHYRLVLRREGTELDFDHPDIHLEPSKTLSLNLGFSKMVFRRDGKTFYNLRHDYGETADLISIQVDDIAAGKTIYKGRLVDFMTNRETAIWLQEGAYRVTLDNKWSVSAGKTRQAAVLKNALGTEFQVAGGQKLNFDTQINDYLLPTNVLSRDYLIAHADESPFKAPTPMTQKEVATLARHQAKRYRKGTFDRFRENARESDSLYPYLGAKTMDNRVGELVQEKVPRSTKRYREAIKQEKFQVPYHNSHLNKRYRDIHDRPIPPRKVAPAHRYERPMRKEKPLHLPAKMTTEDYLAREASAIPHIDPRRPSRSELLRMKARKLRPTHVPTTTEVPLDGEVDNLPPKSEVSEEKTTKAQALTIDEQEAQRIDRLLSKIRKQMDG